MPFSSESLQPLLMMAGMGLICWLLVRGKMRRRPRGDLPVRVDELKFNSNAHRKHDQFSGRSSLGAPSDVLKWQVELHDLGRELKAELDSKMIAVRTLCKSYDQAAKRLSELIRLAEEVEAVAESPLHQIQRLCDAGWEPSKISRMLGIPLADVELLMKIPGSSTSN